MWSIKNQQLSFRISDEIEKAELNQLALSLQKSLNTEFTSAKDFFYAIVNRLEALENAENKTESNVNEIENAENNTENVVNEVENIENNSENIVNEVENAETNSENIVNEIENIENNSSNELKTRLISEIGYENTPTDDQLYSDILEIISTPLSPAPTVEIEKEVIKEVERQLGEYDVLVELSSSQHELLRKIARWRSSTKRDEKTLELDKLIKLMIFNRGTLTNDHGAFETGLSSNRLS